MIGEAVYAAFRHAQRKRRPGQRRVLVQKIEGAPTISGARMPFGGPFLTQAEINLVRAWIAQGALNN